MSWTEYVFLEVKKSPAPLVTLVGPRKVISDIYQSIRQSLNKRDFNNLLWCAHYRHWEAVWS